MGIKIGDHLNQLSNNAISEQSENLQKAISSILETSGETIAKAARTGLRTYTTTIYFNGTLELFRVNKLLKDGMSWERKLEDVTTFWAYRLVKNILSENSLVLDRVHFAEASKGQLSCSLTFSW